MNRDIVVIVVGTKDMRVRKVCFPFESKQAPLGASKGRTKGQSISISVGKETMLEVSCVGKRNNVGSFLCW